MGLDWTPSLGKTHLGGPQIPDKGRGAAHPKLPKSVPHPQPGPSPAPWAPWARPSHVGLDWTPSPGKTHLGGPPGLATHFGTNLPHLGVPHSLFPLSTWLKCDPPEFWVMGVQHRAPPQTVTV